MARLSIVLLCFFLSFYIGFSQSTTEINDLRDSLQTFTSKKELALTQLRLAEKYQKANRDTSRYYSDKAMLIAKELKDDSLLAAAYFRQAFPEYYKSNDTFVLGLYSKIDSLAINHQNIQEIVIETKIYRSEISKFTFTMEGVLKAKEYLLEGLSIAQSIENEYLENRMTQRLGSWHGFISQEVSPEKHLDTAETLLLKVLPYFIKKKDLDMTAEVYESLTFVHLRAKRPEKEKFYLDKLLETLKILGNPRRIAEAYYQRGSSYKKKNNPKPGLAYLDSAKAIYDRVGYPNETEKKNLFRDYGYLYSDNGEYKKAFENMQKALVQSYTVYKDENIKTSMEMEAKYENQRKKQEITLLKTKNSLVEQQKKNQRNMLLGGLGLTTTAGIFLFLGYRNRKKTNNKLRELDATKSNFFANISHEFRTPLSLISGPIEEQLKKELPSEERTKLQIAQRNSTRLVTLVDQLLDLSKLESGHFKLTVQKTDIHSFLKSLISSFEYLAQENNHEYKTHITIPKPQVWFDVDALEKIVTNLISNAIKYSPQGEHIMINAHIQDHTLKFIVKNSGAPLSSSHLDTLFNRFERADETGSGTGIGLALTKELVQLHKGTITAESDAQWTTFQVTIPVNEISFSVHEKKEGNEVKGAFAKAKTSNTAHFKDTVELEEFDIFSKDDKPILLIVDDNADLRTYAKSLFIDTHTIYTAVDGKDGFEQALRHVPDLIITDLMMPKDDGIMLTQNCKNNEATSHIPILMLTAKAGDENELIGLETGADAYITKPFNTEILKTTVHNLQETRKKLQERFSQEVVLLPKDIATNSIDERFLTNLQEVMDKNLVESDFNTESFAEAVGMSRMQLHRKLKALTGLSASEFIRGQRLKLAAQMLKKSEINVSQVGYSVGFNNHSYFTKCFKEQYGVSPSEYAKKS